MEFSKRLKLIRTQKQLSVAEVAQKSGVAPSSYQEWEQGRRILDVQVYFKLAKALEVTPGELILGKSKKKEIHILVEKLDGVMREIEQIKSSLLSGEF